MFAVARVRVTALIVVLDRDPPRPHSCTHFQDFDFVLWACIQPPDGSHGPKKTLAPESQAPLGDQGPVGPMDPFGDRPMAQGSMA